LLVQALSAGKLTGAGGTLELPPPPPTPGPFPPTPLPLEANPGPMAPVHADATTDNAADAKMKLRARKPGGFLVKD
jgi:hypothetical protein